MKQFEDLTIKELKEMHIQFIKQNPDFKTAQELLDEKGSKGE